MAGPESTYDITSLVGQTRFHAGDTQVAGGVSIWTDAELGYLLALVGNVPELAAARALRMAAADAAKLAIISKTDSTSTDLTKVADKLLDSAAALEAQCFVSPAVIAPDQIFTMPIGGSDSTMDLW